jgi:hypothetical protein
VSVVRPELGPTLPELVGPRLRTWPRAARVALAALAVLVLAALVAWRVGPGARERVPAVVAEPVAFNLAIPKGMRRVAPARGESLRLETPAGAAAPQSFAVAPLRLAAYRGDVSAALMGLSPALIERMRADVPGFVWRGDGRVNFNRQPGYQVLFQARIGGRTTYGRRIMLVPGGDEPPREGLDVTLLAQRSPAVPSLDVVGTDGALKRALFSLRFGTDPP